MKSKEQILQEEIAALNAQIEAERTFPKLKEDLANAKGHLDLARSAVANRQKGAKEAACAHDQLQKSLKDVAALAKAMPFAASRIETVRNPLDISTALRLARHDATVDRLNVYLATSSQRLKASEALRRRAESLLNEAKIVEADAETEFTRLDSLLRKAVRQPASE